MSYNIKWNSIDKHGQINLGNINKSPCMKKVFKLLSTISCVYYIYIFCVYVGKHCLYKLQHLTSIKISKIENIKCPIPSSASIIILKLFNETHWCKSQCKAV